MKTHIFRDGIERSATQHPNGGGWVASGAKVAASVYVDTAAEVIGGEIRGGEILGGEIHGGVIRGGEIHGGVIRGGEIWGGEIHGGVIRGGEIHGGVIRGGEIWGGEIYGGVVSRDVTYICGCVPYQVTITDTHAGVGCQWHTLAEWEEKGAKIAAENEQPAELLSLLLTFIKMHKAGAK